MCYQQNGGYKYYQKETKIHPSAFANIVKTTNGDS